MPRVELFTRAAMHGNRIDAGCLGKFCHLDDIDRSIIPPLAHLDGNWHLDGPADGRKDGKSLFRLAHQGRAFAVLHDFRSGAAHVEIENIRRAEPFDKGRGLSSHLRCIGKNLHGERPFRRLRLQHRERPLIAEMDALRRDHLRKAERTAHVMCDDAVRRIRHAGHWRQKDRRLKIKFTDLHENVLSDCVRKARAAL